ncbi:MAG TPA: phytoene desaturase family protein, partial [Cyclobacteriaceae bacterium]
MLSKKVAVIGSGFSGLASACFLSQAGYDVTIFEKNESPGGRARKFEAEGFLFDMGPSWYWMPDVFQKFFGHFGKQVSDFYDLVRLDPSYRVYFSAKDFIDLPAGIVGLVEMFDSIEPGSGDGLKKILAESKYKYQVGINNLVYKPGLEFSELFDAQLLSGIFKLHAFQSVSSYIRKYVKSPRLIQLLEFPVLFLGASPQRTPALYSLMNYADMALGTWYPMGGMHKIVEGITSLALSLGVKFEFGSEVQKIIVDGTRAAGLQLNDEEKKFDY